VRADGAHTVLSLGVLTQLAAELGQQQRAKLLLALCSVQRPRCNKQCLESRGARARRGFSTPKLCKGRTWCEACATLVQARLCVPGRLQQGVRAEKVTGPEVVNGQEAPPTQAGAAHLCL